MFVQECPDSVAQARAVFDAIAVGEKDFAHESSLIVRLPNYLRQAAEVDSGQLESAVPIVIAVVFFDLGSLAALQNQTGVAQVLKATSDFEAIALGFEDQRVTGS